MADLQKLSSFLEDLSIENYVVLVKELCTINNNNIQDELIQCPSIFAYWNGILSSAKRDRDMQELTLNTFVADSRKTFKECTGTKLTAKDLDDQVMSTIEYTQINKEFIKKCEKYDMIKSLIEALSQKKDMLIQLSANQRAESNLYK